MSSWLFGLLKRLALFNISVIGLAQAYSWLFGYDDEFKAWAAMNRDMIALALVLSSMLYAVYDWLEESERQKEK